MENSIEISLEEQNSTNSCLQKKRWSEKLPCLKFAIAAGLSVSSFVLGCTMIVILPPADPLIPFYSSLITGALAVWIDAPKYNPVKTN